MQIVALQRPTDTSSPAARKAPGMIEAYKQSLSQFAVDTGAVLKRKATRFGLLSLQKALRARN